MDPVLIQIYELVIPAAPFVIGAYVVLWLGLFVYVFMVDRRIGKVEAQIALVEETVTRKGAAG